jgi:hypothetical protein
MIDAALDDRALYGQDQLEDLVERQEAQLEGLASNSARLREASTCSALVRRPPDTAMGSLLICLFLFAAGQA